MKNLAYLIIGFFISIFSVIVPFSVSDSNLVLNDCEVTCRINPKFTTDFSNCMLSFYDVWKTEECNYETFMFSRDGGDNWLSGVLASESIRVDGDNCDILLKANESSRPYKSTSNVVCNCGPCLPSKTTQKDLLNRFLQDPSLGYLDFEGCCCREYSFSINNVTISSILISLRIHADYLNGIRYSISSIDDADQMIYLKPTS